MRRLLMALAAAVVLAISAAPVRAQFIQVYSPPVMVAPRPVVSYYPPVTSFYAPSVTTYSPPVAAYSYYPPTTVYSAPTAVVAPGVVTRSYVGYGIFRPRGVYTQSFYATGPVIAPTTAFYPSIFVR